ncbi:MAG: hypothetical protein A3J55_03545 [Candidatus Ryanbacteria bacterium RIFCSPHIGHO2_02_FULL_45_17b]|uniref:Uncharacterized protein n=1 Tax=Candidatus Ryanbacteria bacterium RIFCSPHIGHO2_01_FULL_45_22 TaxID=1802114 RepID=A0A1G2G238_9BACT|nr:MAG: hypothetical protein A2719_04745 [Candidatus Ryanbacteria bacterium RIFCSPHIGHO2_01_FULL_45_22]OGZ47534.1 MAG: hypothetical protein A3J55_03545 [Candidatus Ryanbacteria bacterium RIFCSPHIGHO2_02_FULL_45_17b]
MNEQQKPGEIPDKSVRPSSEPQLENENKLPKLHTMKQDAAQYLKDRNISFLDLVSKEHEYAQEHPEKFEYRERVTEKAWFRGVLGLVFLVVVAAISYGVYVFLLTTDTLPPTETTPDRAFIPVEEREIITIRDDDRAGLLEKLEAARRDRLPSRSIKHVIVRIESFGGGSRFATIKDVMETLDFKTPNGFLENLNDKFDILVYYRPDGADIGFLLELKDHERAFAHMLGWEKDIMLDFRNLYFDADVTQPLLLFTDNVVRNIDVRSVPLQEHTTFSYGIFAKRFLIIATSDEFMDVLLGRLLVAPPR